MMFKEQQQLEREEDQTGEQLAQERAFGAAISLIQMSSR